MHLNFSKDLSFSYAHFSDGDATTARVPYALNVSSLFSFLSSFFKSSGEKKTYNAKEFK
jgi:hypothetical protein